MMIQEISVAIIVSAAVIHAGIRLVRFFGKKKKEEEGIEKCAGCPHRSGCRAAK
jgi:hypothetical protein